MTSFNGWGDSWGTSWGNDEPGAMVGSASFTISATGDLSQIEQAVRTGGAPAWNPYVATGESEEQKRNRRIAQDIIKKAQKPDADIAKLSIKARDVSQRLKADAERFEAFAAQLALELERAYTKRLLAEVMQARNNALATRQLEQQMIAAQLQAEANRQQIEELDVVFMVVMLAAL
jgi:hypothetical protein